MTFQDSEEFTISAKTCLYVEGLEWHSVNGSGKRRRGVLKRKAAEQLDTVLSHATWDRLVAPRVPTARRRGPAGQ